MVIKAGMVMFAAMILIGSPARASSLTEAAKPGLCVREDAGKFCQRCEVTLNGLTGFAEGKTVRFGCETRLRPYMSMIGNLSAGMRVRFAEPATSYTVEIEIRAKNSDAVKRKFEGTLPQAAREADIEVNVGTGNFDKVPGDGAVELAVTVTRCRYKTRSGKTGTCTLDIVPLEYRPDALIVFSAS